MATKYLHEIPIKSYELAMLVTGCWCFLGNDDRVSIINWFQDANTTSGICCVVTMML